MQNTLANRCQTRINGGCEVEFNPHHEELLCTPVLSAGGAGFYKSKPGSRRWTHNLGSLFKLGRSLVPGTSRGEAQGQPVLQVVGVGGCYAFLDFSMRSPALVL